MFLSGQIPKEESELKIIIEDEKETKKIDTTYKEIQKEKKKADLREYVMKEYAHLLGPSGAGARGEANL